MKVSINKNNLSTHCFGNCVNLRQVKYKDTICSTLDDFASKLVSVGYKLGEAVFYGLNKIHTSHEYNVSIIKAATCTEDGSERSTCTSNTCGYHFDTVLSSTGHSFSRKSFTTTNGIITAKNTCTKCGIERETVTAGYTAEYLVNRFGQYANTEAGDKMTDAEKKALYLDEFTFGDKNVIIGEAYTCPVYVTTILDTVVYCDSYSVNQNGIGYTTPRLTNCTANGIFGTLKYPYYTNSSDKPCIMIQKRLSQIPIYDTAEEAYNASIAKI